MTQKKSAARRNPIKAGDEHGRLTAVRYSHHDKWRAAHWLFKCECGEDYIARPDWVRRGVIISCGCYREEQAAERCQKRATHGHSKDGKLTSEYNSWRNMRDRCNSPASDMYEYYGGRGIRVCEHWQNSFENFLADMGPKPTPKHTIERKDVNGHYIPDNCIWVAFKAQMRNRTKTRWVTYQGREMSLAEACELAGVPRSRVNARLRLGWSVERALTQPNRDD